MKKLICLMLALLLVLSGCAAQKNETKSTESEQKTTASEPTAAPTAAPTEPETESSGMTKAELFAAERAKLYADCPAITTPQEYVLSYKGQSVTLNGETTPEAVYNLFPEETYTDNDGNTTVTRELNTELSWVTYKNYSAHAMEWEFNYEFTSAGPRKVSIAPWMYTGESEDPETAALNGISLQTTIGEVFAQLGTPSEDSESNDTFLFVWRFDDGVTIMITVTYTENSKPLRDILIDDILVTWY